MQGSRGPQALDPRFGLSRAPTSLSTCGRGYSLFLRIAQEPQDPSFSFRLQHLPEELIEKVLREIESFDWRTLFALWQHGLFARQRLLSRILAAAESFDKLAYDLPEDACPPHAGLIDAFSDAERPTFVHSPASALEASAMFRATCPRPTTGPSIVTAEEFKRNWRVFTHNQLGDDFDWTGIVALGGAVFACLLPHSCATDEALRSHYEKEFPPADIDLFFVGSVAFEQVLGRLKDRLEALFGAKYVILRTANTITFCAGHPFRNVQMTRCRWRSPSGVASQADVDCTRVVFDGQRVWFTCAARLAFNLRCNFVNTAVRWRVRGCPTYEKVAFLLSMRSK